MGLNDCNSVPKTPPPTVNSVGTVIPPDPTNETASTDPVPPYFTATDLKHVQRYGHPNPSDQTSKGHVGADCPCGIPSFFLSQVHNYPVNSRDSDSKEETKDSAKAVVSDVQTALDSWYGKDLGLTGKEEEAMKDVELGNMTQEQDMNEPEKRKNTSIGQRVADVIFIILFLLAMISMLFGLGIIVGVNIGDDQGRADMQRQLKTAGIKFPIQKATKNTTAGETVYRRSSMMAPIQLNYFESPQSVMEPVEPRSIETENGHGGPPDIYIPPWHKPHPPMKEAQSIMEPVEPRSTEMETGHGGPPEISLLWYKFHPPMKAADRSWGEVMTTEEEEENEVFPVMNVPVNASTNV